MMMMMMMMMMMGPNEVMSTVGLGDINMDLVNERGLLCLIMSAAKLAE